MNRNQKITLAAAIANLALILLFPPFDQYSIGNARVPAFAGFMFIGAQDHYNVINSSVLALEVLVVAVNAAIAWILLGNRSPGRRLSLQNVVLLAVGANLILILLFPPFESIYALTNAALPSFEGFYLIFARQPNHTIVATLLYLEVIFVLINGALLWIFFRERRRMTVEEAFAGAASVLRARDSK